MSATEARRSGRTWPYALGGALFLVGIVVLRNAGEYEGGNVMLVLGPLAALIGGLLGAFVRGLINRRRGEE